MLARNTQLVKERITLMTCLKHFRVISPHVRGQQKKKKINIFIDILQIKIIGEELWAQIVRRIKRNFDQIVCR